MNLTLETPAVLWLLPLIALPLLYTAQSPQAYPSLAGFERDPLSVAVEWILKAAGAIAIAALILGLGGLHRTGTAIEKRGEGAHIVLLIDRSGSMDNTFAGEAPAGGRRASLPLPAVFSRTSCLSASMTSSALRRSPPRRCTFCPDRPEGGRARRRRRHGPAGPRIYQRRARPRARSRHAGGGHVARRPRDRARLGRGRRH